MERKLKSIVDATFALFDVQRTDNSNVVGLKITHPASRAVHSFTCSAVEPSSMYWLPINSVWICADAASKYWGNVLILLSKQNPVDFVTPEQLITDGGFEWSWKPAVYYDDVFTLVERDDVLLQSPWRGETGDRGLKGLSGPVGPVGEKGDRGEDAAASIPYAAIKERLIDIFWQDIEIVGPSSIVYPLDFAQYSVNLLVRNVPQSLPAGRIRIKQSSLPVQIDITNKLTINWLRVPGTFSSGTITLECLIRRQTFNMPPFYKEFIINVSRTI